MTYCSAVFYHTVIIMFTIYRFNYLYVGFFDIGNEYINVDRDEKVYFIYGS